MRRLEEYGGKAQPTTEKYNNKNGPQLLGGAEGLDAITNETTHRAHTQNWKQKEKNVYNNERKCENDVNFSIF